MSDLNEQKKTTELKLYSFIFFSRYEFETPTHP